MARQRAQRSTSGSNATRTQARATRSGAPRRRDEEVLQAAVKVFYERGYSDATVQDVADELGILKGSLYHYIDTKEDLLVRLLDEVHEEVERILTEVSAEEGLDPLERLELYVRRQVLYNLANLQRIAIYYHDMDRLSGEHLQRVVSRRKTHERFVTDLIREAQETGLADPSLDAKLVRNCVFATIIWTYRWYHPGGRSSPEKIAGVCGQFVRRGVVGDVTA